jgi:hypothetical protein
MVNGPIARSIQSTQCHQTLNILLTILRIMICGQNDNDRHHDLVNDSAAAVALDRL